MKNKTNLSVIFLSILCLFTISNADTGFGISDIGSLSSILLVSVPNGGENWEIGNQYDITWTYNNVTNVDLEYSIDNGNNWLPIVSNIPASNGSYSWIIPNTPSTTCLVKISDSSDPSVNDVSDGVFTISSPTPTITVTSPNGGERWDVGSTYDITWSSTGITNVKIEYSIDNGTTWVDPPIVASHSASNELYSWIVPDNPSETCIVRISDALNGSIFDISDAPFCIRSLGTTVIIHGYRPFFETSGDLEHSQTWTLTMAKAIAERLGGGQTYALVDGNIVYKPNYSYGTEGEVIVVLDWLEVSDIATFGFAEDAGTSLSAMLIKGAQEGYWNLNQLHFIGHSRGTVVASEAIQRFDMLTSIPGMLSSSLPIDPQIHFTAIDAHPWDDRWGDHIADPLTANDNDVNGAAIDTGVVCWDIVSYADNYWHWGGFWSLGWHFYFDLNGLSLFPGCSFNKDLSYDFSNYDNIGHGEMHAWYYGTVAHDSIDDGDGKPIDPNNSNWYPNGERYVDTLGYNVSRSACGTTNHIVTVSTNSFNDDNTLNRYQIFNGDFSKHEGLTLNNLPAVPGWDYHGGGGDGDIDRYDNWNLNPHLELDRNNESKTHNYFYIPQDADRIWYRVKVNIASHDGDLLKIYFGNTLRGFVPLNMNTNYELESIDITAFQGEVDTLRFEIDPVNDVDSEVWVDDISFIPITRLYATVACPVNFHAFDVYGNHTGPTSDTTWVTEIPGSQYIFESDTLPNPRKTIILPPPQSGTDYSFVIESQDTTGHFYFQIEDYTTGIQTVNIIFDSVTVQPNTIATCTLATVSPSLPLYIDIDGDGQTDTTLTATQYFEDFSVIASAGQNGIINPNDTVIVNYGDSISFTITPDSGYAISDILVDSVSVGPVSSYTFNNVVKNHTIYVTFQILTSILVENAIPKVFYLSQNYPNPFNPIATIKYGLPKASNVKLEIYNILGQKIMILVNAYKIAGYYEAKLDAYSLASGIYLYRIQAGDFHQVKKMVVMK